MCKITHEGTGALLYGILVRMPVHKHVTFVVFNLLIAWDLKNVKEMNIKDILPSTPISPTEALRRVSQVSHFESTGNSKIGYFEVLIRSRRFSIRRFKVFT